jgi:ubiquinone/menaquinone biosynthesis C-methylase UbiE
MERWVYGDAVGVDTLFPSAEAAPVDAWRDYDADDPDPGYYQFDWLSSRHPDLYHRFALSTVGLMEELPKVVDLTGLVVVDVGAGTGRSTHAAARSASKVYAVDAYPSVLEFNAREARRLGLDNIEHVHADRAAIPLEDDSVDAVICAWAELDHAEAWRVLRPGGVLVHAACQEPWIAGELTSALFGGASVPAIDVHAPAVDWVLDGAVHVHDFPYVATFESVDEAVAIHARLMGPAVAAYLRERNQRTVAWALRIHSLRHP